MATYDKSRQNGRRWFQRKEVVEAQGGILPPRIVAIIPAHNEADCIADTLESLLAQTRVPDKIVVAADNCNDDTFAIASRFAAADPRILVFETVDNKHRKVGALTQAFNSYAREADFILGVDADTVLDKECVDELEKEMVSNSNLGGVMARYTFDPRLATGFFSRMLIRIQRLEFAGWTMDILRRNRDTYVLGGQCTLFRGDAMRQVADTFHREGPWSTETQVEDMELTWRLDELGWSTLCNPVARAYVGPMVTIKSFWAQRRKWDTGIAQLLLEAGFNKETSYPWRLQFKMSLDLIIRVLFAVLFTGSQVRDSYQWFWVWLIPPALGILVNLRTALMVPNRKFGDILWAVTLIGPEIYLWFRLTNWTVSWLNAIFGVRNDAWERQYRAEGKVQ